MVNFHSSNSSEDEKQIKRSRTTNAESQLEKVSNLEIDHKLNFTIINQTKVMINKTASLLKDFSQNFSLEEVPPLHLACTAAHVLDSFPVKGDLNFSSEYGLESDYFQLLLKYLGGNNVGERKMPLNFPIFLTVTPKSNSSVERAMCVWLSEFSSLVGSL